MIDKEGLLTIWLGTEPSARSPYALYGNPPMWKTLEYGDMVLFTRPGRVMERPAPFMPYQEVDGVHYQWQKNGEWHDQGMQATFDYFFGVVAKLGTEPPAPFNWRQRTGQMVLDLPFVEGLPSQEKAEAITKWVKANADRYENRLVKMYHGTDPSLPIEKEGLRPATASRRRSYQSESGYVYLANTPERAENFGKLGNSGRCVVYEVVVPVRKLLPDTDQLNNQRAASQDVGDSIGESVVYGGGARVKGRIEPWQVRVWEDPKNRIVPPVIIVQPDSGHQLAEESPSPAP